MSDLQAGKIDNMAKRIKRLRKETKNIIVNFIFGALNLLLVVFLYENILLTAASLLLLTIIFIIYYKSPHILIPVFVFCMLFGALAEIFAVHNGVWVYTSSDFLSIPVWLFILWGNAGMFIYRVAIELERLGFHEKREVR